MSQLLDPNSQQLEEWLSEHDQPGFRARQVRRWLAAGRASSFADMTDLPAELRDQLQQQLLIWSAKIQAHRKAKDGTEKLLLDFDAGGQIECVLLRDGARRTICISSQVGCAMGCVFCASGLDGVDRNLSSAEIIEQMIRLQHCLPAEERLSHIVVMGMGEPLANLDNVLPALKFASSEDGLGISARRITISTVGLPSAIRRLAEDDGGYQLAVSLHAADDQLRNQLVPVNPNTGLSEIMAAADEYFERSGRRLTFEYVLLAGVNDQPEHARRLVKLLAGRTAMLNVIPYNPVAGLPYQTPGRRAIWRFRSILEDGQLNVQLRQRKGDDIDAACGQLRRTLGSPPDDERSGRDAGIRLD